MILCKNKEPQIHAKNFLNSENSYFMANNDKLVEE